MLSRPGIPGRRYVAMLTQITFLLFVLSGFMLGLAPLLD